MYVCKNAPKRKCLLDLEGQSAGPFSRCISKSASTSRKMQEITIKTCLRQDKLITSWLMGEIARREEDRVIHYDSNQ